MAINTVLIVTVAGIALCYFAFEANKERSRAQKQYKQGVQDTHRQYIERGYARYNPKTGELEPTPERELYQNLTFKLTSL